MIRHLPEFKVPVENDDYIPLVSTLDGKPTTNWEMAIVQAVSDPLVWTGYPGPKTPQTIGRYLVYVRAVGQPAPEDPMGTLVVF